jgi:hypothetical protein
MGRRLRLAILKGKLAPATVSPLNASTTTASAPVRLAMAFASVQDIWRVVGAIITSDVFSKSPGLGMFMSMLEKDKKAPVDYGYGPGVGIGPARPNLVLGQTPAIPQSMRLAPQARPGAAPLAGGGGCGGGGCPGSVATLGIFGPPFPWPIIPIHMALLPDGRVLSYGTDETGAAGAQFIYDVWDPKLGNGTNAHNTQGLWPMPASLAQSATPRRSLGVSGTHFVAPPSPSLDAAAIVDIEPKDRIRHEAAKALETARSCAEVACKTAREIHVDATLDMPTRHRKAHDQSFELISPALQPLEAARAKNAKAREELGKITAGPTLELSDAAAIEIRTRLEGLPKDRRMAAVDRSIKRGDDRLPAALFGVGADRFLSESIFSDLELDSIRRQWALTRFPAEVARLAVLEKDERALAAGAAALQAFQRGCADASIVAGNHPGIQAGGTSGRLTGSPYGREGTGGINGAALRARGG